MNEVGRLSLDVNNNAERKSTGVQYVERHLDIGTGDVEFLIIPNGGSGDCMFKAVSQAVYQGDESRHREIRKRVVNFIISQKWDKFSESIEVQHINGNNLLQRQWSKDPKEAYRMYMSLAGTLGSSSELTAAGELFHYDFATIQEYSGTPQSTYRVENCVLFDDSNTDFHYFYFTGDFDNGHWEYIRNLTGKKLADGTYQGHHRIVINGEEICFEDWLKRETENDNEPEQLKIATNHDLYYRRRTTHPFELKGFHFSRDGTVQLKGISFTVAPVQHSDLFSVLAHECLKNEASAHDIELILMKHRYSYFEDLNYKLITQPWSHNFTVDAIRYCGQSRKGNIQDLIAAADLYSFSFILFLKMSDDADTHQCKFTHVDRWGGESDRILYFFMRLSRFNNGEKEQLISKWWRLIPVDGSSPKASKTTFQRKSTSRLDGGDSSATRRTISMKSATTSIAGRPMTADSYTTHTHSDLKPLRNLTVRPSSVQETGLRSGSLPYLETAEDILLRAALAQSEPKVQVLEGGITVTRISDSDEGLETDQCLQKDHDKIFGHRPLSRKSSVMVGNRVRSKEKTKLVKRNKSMSMEKVKPATRRDLLKYPNKVKTLVKVSDRSVSGRQLTYRGNGYMKADDVLTDLRSQGIIKMPRVISDRPKSVGAKQIDALKQIYSGSIDNPQYHFDDLLTLRDENFNIIQNKKEDENQYSDISFENFAASSQMTQAAMVHDDNLNEKSLEGQQQVDMFPLGMEYSRSKMNKVAPCPNETNQDYDDSYFGYKGESGHHQDGRHSCFEWLRNFFARIFDRFRTITKRVKKGVIERYQGLNSQSLMNMHRKDFPRTRYYS